MTTSSGSQQWIRLTGVRVEGALDRHAGITGFDQQAFSSARVLCVGAGGLISHVAPTLVRKGIGELLIVDGDDVEPSNLNRQYFYSHDIEQNKAICLARNVQHECVTDTLITGCALNFDPAKDYLPKDLNAVICGVDSNPARVGVSRHYRGLGVPVVFMGVSEDGDFGYVFLQENEGPCFECLFPDAVHGRYPCPGTPAMKDIVQAIGAFATFALDTLVCQRARTWNYREFCLSAAETRVARISRRQGCGCQSEPAGFYGFRKS